jgi:hypothetical protein
MSVTTLETTCDVSLFEDLPAGEQLLKKLKWSTDLLSFIEDPAGLGLTLWDSQREILGQFLELNDEGYRKKSEMVFVSGMRGGKTTIAAIITLCEIARLQFLDNPQKFYNIASNSEIMCVNVAPNEQQALDTVFRRAKEIIMNSPFMMSLHPTATYNTIKFPKQVTLKALGSSTSGNVGRTVKCFVADEVSSFQDNSARRGPSEIYFKLSKSTGTFSKWNENVRVAISSPAYKGDFITTLHDQAVEEKWDWCMPIWKATWDLNPNMDKETLAEERKRDPISFDRDFGAQPSQEQESFFNPVMLAEVKKKSIHHLNLFIGDPDPKSRDAFIPILDENRLDLHLYPNYVDWYIAADPAIKNDAFGLSIGYLGNDDVVYVVGSTVFKAARGEEINTDDIANILKRLIQTFPVSVYIYDVYLHNTLLDLVRLHSVRTEHNIVNLNDWILTRNDLYLERASVPHSEYLFRELNELLLIKNQKVDHPRSGSKDMADTAAQLISFVRREQEEARLSTNGVVTNYMGRF